MIIYSIYKIVNHINGKVYIGMTRKGVKRFKTHIYLSKCKKPQILIQEKIGQYGADNFSFSILYQTKDLEHAKDMESHFIGDYDSLVPKGYNIHVGGNYATNYTVSENTMKSMFFNNPGSTIESLKKKTSLIQAKNHITGTTIIIEDRKTFSEEQNIPYTSIGWAIQHNKTLKNGWQFSYLIKRTMGK